MYLSFATILLAWYGIRLMLAPRGSGEAIFGLARLLLLVSFGFAMLKYYEDPLPGIGVSFSNLITDQTAHLASLLSARSIQNARRVSTRCGTRSNNRTRGRSQPPLLGMLLIIRAPSSRCSSWCASA
jgi:hypothetical protein